MKIESITATVEHGDGKKNVDDRYATVTITLGGGAQVTVMVHQSHAFSNTLNIEIDGDFTDDDPAMRVVMNDQLIHDTVMDLVNPYEAADNLSSRRIPDLPEDDDDEDD